MIATGNFNLIGGTLGLGSLNSRGEPALVIANYGSLTSGAFTTITGLVGGYTLDYNYQGLNQIALVRGNTKLFFNGQQGTNLGAASNFSTDAALLSPTAQTPTAAADVYFDNGGTFNSGSAATTSPPLRTSTALPSATAARMARTAFPSARRRAAPARWSSRPPASITPPALAFSSRAAPSPTSSPRPSASPRARA